MSEAELTSPRGMYQGRLNKAAGGEVYTIPSSGYVARPAGEFALGSRPTGQDTIRLLLRQVR